MVDAFTVASECSVMVAGSDGIGSGTVVRVSGDKTYILTCAHVVTPGEKYDVETLVNGDRIVHPAMLEHHDKKLDLCILSSAGKVALSCAQISKHDPARWGKLYSIGCGGSIPWTPHEYTLGIRSGRYWAISGPVHAGMSGAGLYDSAFELVGVVCKGWDDEDGKHLLSGFAIPRSTIRRYIKAALPQNV